MKFSFFDKAGAYEASVFIRCFIIMNQGLRAKLVLSAFGQLTVFRKDLPEHRKSQVAFSGFLCGQLHILNKMLDVETGCKIAVKDLAAQQIELPASGSTSRD